MSLKRIKNPILFQGGNQSRDYFEGWYYKQVTGDGQTTVSLIPGISLERTHPHCFVQVIVAQTAGDGTSSLRTGYCRFPISAFSCSDDPFSLLVGGNRFTGKGLSVDLGGTVTVKGHLAFGELRGIETSALHPNIMGFFAYIPAMECYHGIVSMTHTLSGSLEIDGLSISFDGGRGYIEKDWGRSFPRSYLWIQSNHFERDDVSLMCSVARIPFLGGAFRGFLCNLTIGDREYRFASYNRSRLTLSEFTSTDAAMVFRRKNLSLSVKVQTRGGAFLQAPVHGSMEHKIKEGLSGVVSVTLSEIGGKELFSGLGTACGIELMPDNRE